MRSAPQKALDFFAFDLYKSILSRGNPAAPGRPVDPTLQQTFLAAGLAGATSCLLLYPLEVARMRMTLAPAGRYAGVLDCLRSVVRAEGAGALLRGLGPSLAAIFPEAAITYGGCCFHWVGSAAVGSVVGSVWGGVSWGGIGVWAAISSGVFRVDADDIM